MTRRRRPRALHEAWPVLGAVALLFSASSAAAAPQRRDTGPLFTQIDTGQGAAAAARALAAKGNCAAALASFDASLRSSIDMTIRRDRGLCHEQLGHPFPAMDDYRAYLTVSPDAPDSADIRVRLERLETLTGVGGPSALEPARSAEEVPQEAARIGDLTIETSDTGKRSRARRTSYDAEEDTYHHYDQAMTSPLRRGTGGIFGVYGTGVALGIGFGNGPNGGLPFGGGTSTFIPGFEIGAKIGWSFSQVSSVYGQIGYADYQVSAIGVTVPIGGIGLALGYEARIRLDQYSTHAIVLGPAFEYQYISGASAGGAGSGGGVSILIPEGRAGYRVILGYGFGLEFLADVGVPIFFASGAQGASRDPIVGGTVSLLLAF